MGYIIFPMDDNRLMEMCVKGDTEAWEKLVDQFSGLVYWAIKRKLSRHPFQYSDCDIRDIYQQVFAVLWEKRSRVKPAAWQNLSPWLVALSSHTTIDFMRKSESKERFLKAYGQEERTQADEPLLADERRIIEEALSRLKIKERSYIELFYGCGKKYREIAEDFHVPLSSVSSAISRAQKKIRRHLMQKKFETK